MTSALVGGDVNAPLPALQPGGRGAVEDRHRLVPAAVGDGEPDVAEGETGDAAEPGQGAGGEEEEALRVALGLEGSRGACLGRVGVRLRGRGALGRDLAA
jgi:hypothetical protein